MDPRLPLPPEELRARLPPLGDARALVIAAMAAGLRPPPRRNVADWAVAERIVSPESGGPFPGRWSHSVAPYMVEPMNRMGLADPCGSVTLKKSAQIGGSEAGLNLLGQLIDDDPCTILVVLPTLEEGKKYNRVKLQPTIEATPALRRAVRDITSRDSAGSTTAFKKFPGGWLQLTGANSSAGLQMISVRVLLLEEVSGFPYDVDGRGDPVDMAEARTTAFVDTVGAKKVYISTPNIVGSCRITARYEASTQRRYYLPCPHCGVFQVLVWERLRPLKTVAPWQVVYDCGGCGKAIAHWQKREMVNKGCWVSCYPDGNGEMPADVLTPAQLRRWQTRPDGDGGRDPGYYIWQGYSLLVGWDQTWKDWLNAKGDPEKERVFSQQRLGLAWEEGGDAPDHAALHARREEYPLRQIPPGGLALTGFADVQGNRLEYAVYAWGVGLTGWLVDVGVIEGDPELRDVWDRLDAEVVNRTYPDASGREWPIDAFGVDSGYLSNTVYLYTRGRPNVLATDGRPGRMLPHISAPVLMTVTRNGRKHPRGVKVYPLGTWRLKAWLYGSLRKTLKGPETPAGEPEQGALHFPLACTEEFFRQLTAEYVKETERRDGSVERRWVKSRGQANEQLDMVVGARAMAAHLGLDDFTTRQWQKLAETRGVAATPEVQRDMADLWTPALAARELVRDRAGGKARRLADILP